MTTTGNLFPDAFSAQGAAAWWNDQFETATTRATYSFRNGCGSADSGWHVSVEVRERDSWVIAEYLPADRELWGQMRLPLVTA